MKRLLALLLFPLLASAQYYPYTDIPPGTVHTLTGVDATGVSDVTAAMTTFLQQGGVLNIPKGDYLITGTGPSSGGVYPTLTKSIRVECDPGATFHGTNLDHDMFFLTIPALGAGLTAQGISIIWHGCIFDQTQQKTSTSVPFSGTYPSTNQGTSAVTDALSVSGEYTADGGVTYKSGIRYFELSGATFIGGVHWQNAGTGSGGDSGTVIGGVTHSEIHGNTFYGNRDASIYMSNGGSGAVDVRGNIYDNYFKSSFQCVAVKRAMLGFSVHDNTCVNAVLGFATQSGGSVVTTGSSEGEIHNNRCSGCQVNDRVDQGTNISIHDEKCDNFGAYLADGTTVPNTYTATSLQLQGMTYSTIRDNTCTSISATYAALNPAFIALGDFASPLTVSTNNRLEHNTSIGFHSIGGENAGSGADFNEFWENYEYTGSVHFISTVGAHSTVTRYDYTNAQRIFMNPQIFDDGAVGAPIIARRSDNTTGIFFGTSLIDFSVGGTERARFTTSGITAVASIVAPITTSAIAVNGTSPSNQTLGSGAGISSSLNGRFTADANGSQQYFFKSRNTTPGSFTTVNTGDLVGRSLYFADDGTTYNSEVGEISVSATGSISTGIVPGLINIKLADSTGTLQTIVTGTSAGIQARGTRYVVCASGTTVSAPSDTTEDSLYDCTIPANALGANGSITFTGRFTYTNSANNKILRVRYSTIGGTAVYQQTNTTSTNQPILPIVIQNKNATNVQESGVNSLTSYTASAGTVQTEAVDTTAASHLVYSCAKALNTETCSISSVLVEIVYAP